VEVGRGDGVEVGRGNGVEVGRGDGVEVGRGDGVDVGRGDGVLVDVTGGLETGVGVGEGRAHPVRTLTARSKQSRPRGTITLELKWSKSVPISRLTTPLVFIVSSSLVRKRSRCSKAVSGEFHHQRCVSSHLLLRSVL